MSTLAVIRNRKEAKTKITRIIFKEHVLQHCGDPPSHQPEEYKLTLHKLFETRQTQQQNEIWHPEDEGALRQIAWSRIIYVYCRNSN